MQEKVLPFVFYTVIIYNNRFENTVNTSILIPLIQFTILAIYLIIKLHLALIEPQALLLASSMQFGQYSALIFLPQY